MSGLGGNIVVVLLGGIIALRFADEDIHDFATLVAVAEFYRTLR